MNQTCEPTPAVLSVVETGESAHLHLVHDHPSTTTLCGRDAHHSEVVRRTTSPGCPTCVESALAAGHGTAATALNSFVNLRRLTVAEDASAPDSSDEERLR